MQQYYPFSNENLLNADNLPQIQNFKKQDSFPQNVRVPFKDISNFNVDPMSQFFENKISASRIKKSNTQIQLLKKTFQENQNWSKSKVNELSKMAGLKHTQVYKWYWDQKLKSKKKENDAIGFKQMKIFESPTENTQCSVATTIYLPSELIQNEEIVAFFKYFFYFFLIRISNIYIFM